VGRLLSHGSKAGLATELRLERRIDHLMRGQVRFRSACGRLGPWPSVVPLARPANSSMGRPLPASDRRFTGQVGEDRPILRRPTRQLFNRRRPGQRLKSCSPVRRSTLQSPPRRRASEELRGVGRGTYRPVAAALLANVGTAYLRVVGAALLASRGRRAPTLAIEPNTSHAADFRRLAARAARIGRGLWGACSRAADATLKDPLVAIGSWRGGVRARCVW
jgi:hypothetical protein